MRILVCSNLEFKILFIFLFLLVSSSFFSLHNSPRLAVSLRYMRVVYVLLIVKILNFLSYNLFPPGHPWS